jgi:ankyrin repeat protein
MLIEEGADLNSKNGFAIDKTPLHKSVKNNRYIHAKKLLDNGATIQNQSRILGCHLTPLHLAAIYSRPHIVALLLRNGADPNTLTTTYSSPLHFVGDLTSARTLIQHGTRLDISNIFGEYPIDTITDIYIARLLHNTYQKNENAIIRLQTQGRIPQLYRYNGAQLPVIFSHTNKQYQKKLLGSFTVYTYFAHQIKFQDIVNTHDIPKKWLLYAIYCMHPNNLNLLLKTQKQLKDNMHRIRTTNTCNTLLHSAIQYNRIECAHVLLQYIDPTLTNKNNETAYDIAKRYNRKEIGRMMRTWHIHFMTLQQPFSDSQAQHYRLPPELAMHIMQYSMR